jgi:hypothetical protein
MSFNHKKKEEHNREIVPSKVDESLSLQTHYHEKPFRRNRNQKFGEKWGSGENFLRWELSIYRGQGAVSRRCLDSTVVRSAEDACPFRHSEGDVFFTEIQKFSWNRIVGVNPLPRGASVGEFRKNLSPSKRRDCRNSWNVFSGWLNLWRSGITGLRNSRICEDLESRTCEA